MKTLLILDKLVDLALIAGIVYLAANGYDGWGMVNIHIAY